MEKIKMKKILSIILVAIMICATLASCSGKSSYEDLAIIDLGLEREYFGIAFRSGSDLTRKVEDITLDLINDGTLAELSTKYEVGAVGKGDYTPKADACADSGDWAYVQAKGTLVIGITDYKPMDYKENGEWVGFDADYARLVCEKLGVTAEFVEIDWDNKLLELEGKTIDCIWNGMTITEERQANMEISIPYLNNKQVAIIRIEDADTYTDLDSMSDAIIGAEAGSAGEACVIDIKE